MFKKSGIALALSSVILGASAADYTLVQKDQIGTGIYYQGTLVNNRAFINSGMSDIELFDISTPSNLSKLDNLPFDCQYDVSNITSDGNIVAAHCNFGIEFFDASDPENIVSVGTFDSPSYAINGIILEGNRLYMFGGNSDILVFDASDLNNLVELGRETVGSVSVVEMKKVGDLIYLANSYNSLDVFDVSDPENLRKLGTNVPSSGQFNALEIIGDYAYIGVGVGLRVVNVSDPSNLTFVTTITQDSGGASLDTIRTMDFDGTNFIAITDDRTVHSIDISTPSAPVISEPIATIEFRAKDIQLNGNSLVIFNGVDGIRTLDISDLGNVSELYHFTESFNPQNISLDGNKALIGDYEAVYHLLELDADLNLIQTKRIAGYYNVNDGYLSNDIARLGTNSTTYTVDLSDLDNLVETDSDILDVSYSSINNYEILEGQLYAGTNAAKIGIYDFDSVSMTEVAQIDLGADPDSMAYRGFVDIAKVGSNLLVTTSETDLTLVNIEDINSPVITHFDWSDYDAHDRHIAVFGDKAFIGRQYGTLVVDISEPSAPSFQSLSSQFGLVDKLEAIDDRYAIISNSSALMLVDFIDEDSPVIVSEIETGMRFQDLAGDLTAIIGTERYGNRITSFQVNQRPISANLSSSVDEDNTLNDTVSVTDREGDSFTITVSQDANNGNVTINNDGTFIYQPSADFFGDDSFTYLVTGLYGNTSESEVTISVNPINDAPVVSSEAFATNEDTLLEGTVEGVDVENDTLTYSVVESVSAGELTFNSDGTFTYLPDENIFGEESFTVIANDGDLDSEVKTIALTINSVNDIPVISLGDLIVDEDSSVEGDVSAEDVEGDTITFAISVEPQNGSASVNSAGAVIYTPNADFNGEDSFTVVGNDGTDLSEAIEVGVTVNPINDAPVATDGSFSVVTGNNLSGTVTGTDVDGDDLIFAVDRNVTNGSLTLNANGSFTYQPNDGFTGSDNFRFSVTDTAGETSTAVARITVSAAPSSGGGSMFWIPLLGVFGLGFRRVKK